MTQLAGSTGKLEKSFAIGAIVAAILVGVALFVLYPNSFKNTLSGTNQGQSQAGSSSQYGGASSPQSSSSGTAPSNTLGGSSSGRTGGGY